MPMRVRSTGTRTGDLHGDTSETQEGRHTMTTSSGDTGSYVFERIEEYKAVLENLVQLSLRRQNTNNVFVGLNTVFLSGLGLLLLSTHVASWWVVGATAAFTLAILPLNLNWRRAIRRYKAGINVRKEYLEEIETEFSERRGGGGTGGGAWATGGGPAGQPSQPLLGLFLRIRDTPLKTHGNSELELRLATYFLALYPLITLLVALLTGLVTLQIIPRFTP
jgi:hypothetical protein